MNLFKLSTKRRENGTRKFSFLISLFFTFFTILMITSCEFMLSNKSDSNPISVEIEHTSGAELNFIMTNNGSTDLYFSSHDVPYPPADTEDPNRGHFNQYFNVTDENGLEVPYIGMLAMLEQTREMWKLIKSGESINFSVNLHGEYQFPTLTGNYKIEFISPVTVMDIHAIEGRAVNEDGDFIPGDDGLKNTVDSNIVESEIVIPSVILEDSVTRAATSPCNATQKSWLEKTKNNAKTITGKAVSHINGGSDAIWVALFGSANSKNLTFTSNGLKKIQGAVGKSWTYNCHNTSNGALAATSKSSPYKVHYYPAFFKNTSETSNKFVMMSSVHVHEASHWNEVIGTSDFAYYSDCAKLAKTPSKAIMNADSYRQYIVNASK